MNVTELIELLLLRHKGAIDLAVFRMFDNDDVNTVYLDLILGWYLVEQTMVPDPNFSERLLESRIILTEKGRRRLTELEAKVPPTMRTALGALRRRRR